MRSPRSPYTHRTFWNPVFPQLQKDASSLHGLCRHLTQGIPPACLGRDNWEGEKQGLPLRYGVRGQGFSYGMSFPPGASLQEACLSRRKTSSPGSPPRAGPARAAGGPQERPAPCSSRLSFWPAGPRQHRTVVPGAQLPWPPPSGPQALCLCFRWESNEPTAEGSPAAPTRLPRVLFVSGTSMLLRASDLSDPVPGSQAPRASGPAPLQPRGVMFTEPGACLLPVLGAHPPPGSRESLRTPGGGSGAQSLSLSQSLSPTFQPLLLLSPLMEGVAQRQ